MALAVDHNVSIVAVSDGEQVGKYTVRSQTTDEISLGFLETTAKVPLVEVAQIGELGLLRRDHFLFKRVD